MSHFIPFTEEELYQAAHTDIKNYLESIGEKVLHSGSEYMWAAHDSVKIRGHVFYQHSTGEKGTAVNFLMCFFNYSFQDAVITLLGGNYIATRKTRPEDMLGKQPDERHHKKSKIILPPKNATNNRLYAYLCKTRKIDINVANYFVRKHLIYEEAQHHNIVFVGKDKNNNVKYAGLKGTLTNHPFKGELPGSNKLYGFKHIGTSDVLFVFEAFVDLLSYITLFQTDENWQQNNYIALNGLVYDTLKKVLSDYSHIKQIFICTDNDFKSSDGINHGQIFAKKVQNSLSKKYEVNIITPVQKDWNEVLIQKELL